MPPPMLYGTFVFLLLHPFPRRRLHAHAVAVVGTPDTSDTGAVAGHGLDDPPQLLAVRVAQGLGLAEDLHGLHVLDAEGYLAAVDEVADDDGVLRRSGGDGELDLGVGGGEPRELGLDEAAAVIVSID